jgi:hypothetical protein
MASAISMNGKKKIETIQKEFTQKFPYLTLIFLDNNRRAIDVSKSLSEVREVKGDDISIISSLKVNTLEKRFYENFGITVEVAYQKDGKIFHTKDSVEKNLKELNEWCQNQGYDEFKFKKKFTGNTLLSVQEQLFESIKEYYSNAEYKKINKDNFLDIYIPEVYEKRGSHLFFNTAKEGIKIGFYCRDEEFVNSVISCNEDIEKYAQGIRIINNPVFGDVEDAVDAAIWFLNNITGNNETEEQSLGETDDSEDEDFIFSTTSSLALVFGNFEDFSTNTFLNNYYNLDTINDEGESQSYLYLDSLQYIKKNEDRFSFGFDYVNVDFDDIDSLIEEIEKINLGEIWIPFEDGFICLSTVVHDSTEELKEKLSDFYKEYNLNTATLFEVVFFNK